MGQHHHWRFPQCYRSGSQEATKGGIITTILFCFCFHFSCLLVPCFFFYLYIFDKFYHIISYHIISYHIISYHIISYHIISYHIISYHIIFYYHSYFIIFNLFLVVKIMARDCRTQHTHASLDRRGKNTK